MGISNIYMVQDKEGKTIIESGTASELAGILKCTRAQVSNSSCAGTYIFGKYKVEIVDRMLGRKKDICILMEFDQVRKEILQKYRRER